MKISLALLTPTLIAAALVGAGPASAAFDAPTTGTYCSTITAGTCITFTSTEASAWTESPHSRQPYGNDGSIAIGWLRKQYAFTGIPDGTTITRQAEGFVQMLYTAAGAPVRTLAINVLVTAFDTKPAACGYYVYDDLLSPMDPTVARDETPADVFAGCGFVRRHSDPAPTTNDPPVTKPAAVAPTTKATACAAITVSKKRVAVTSVGVGCTSARNILASYMRTGREPKGYVCSRLAVGKARSASCGMPNRAAKKITGRWRA